VAKRLFWLILGFGLGVGVTVRARRTLRRTVERVLPPATVDRLRDVNAAINDRAASIEARREARRGR
jgi:hypothetical protein